MLVEEFADFDLPVSWFDPNPSNGDTFKLKLFYSMYVGIAVIPSATGMWRK